MKNKLSGARISEFIATAHLYDKKSSITQNILACVQKTMFVLSDLE